MASDRLWENRDEKIVILDTNSIMMLFEFSINLEGELTRLLGRYHIIIPDSIIDELKLLSEKRNGKTSSKAKASLELVKKYETANLNSDIKADDAVYSLAKQLAGVVVTNDRDLKRKLRAANLHVIYLRGKKKLFLE